MKKVILTVSSCCFLLYTSGQELTWEQKFSAVKAVDDLISSYETHFTFTDIENPQTISEASLTAYHKLFTSDATVYDDLNPSFFDGNANNRFMFTEKPIDDFLAKTKDVYPQGLTFGQITNMNISYEDLVNRAVLVAIEKTTKATTKDAEITIGQLPRNKWAVLIKDTLILTVVLSKDFKSASIQKISRHGAGPLSYKITNDTDGDMVVDAVDKCRTVPGLMMHNGCEAPTGALATILFSGSGGGSTDAFTQGQLENPVFNNSHYNSKEGFGFTASTEFELFVGRERHYGLGLGLMYSQMFSEIHIDQYQATYESNQKDTAGHYFEKIVSNEGQISEKLSFSYFTIPLSLKYKTQLNEKLGIKFNVGVGVSIPIAHSVGNWENNHFNYESRQSILSDGSLGYNSLASNSDDVLTRNAITEYGGDAAAVIEDHYLHGYDVGLNKAPNKIFEEYIHLNPGYSLLIRPTLTYLLEKGAYLNFGLQVLIQYQDNSGFNNNYLLTDKVHEYYTLLGGASNYTHIYYGLTFGISLNLIKGYSNVNVY